MIIIITGASHTGKTLLAQKMLEKYHYPYLSIDHLKMGLIRSGNTDLTPEDDDALTEFLWPIIREIVKTAIENRQNLIVEGCYIPFDWRRDFDERYLPSIRFICLAMTRNYIENHFDEILDHESEIEARLIGSDCTITDLIVDNERCINDFQNAGERIVLIDSDYKPAIRNLLARQLGICGGKNLKQIFESDRISFVEISELLINDYLIMINDNENVNRFIYKTKRDRQFTAEDETVWVRKKLEEKAVIFSMIEKKTGAFIGNIELMEISDSVKELGIAITAKKQNMGYGTEAVGALLEFGFKQFGLQKIVLRANPENGRAICVYKKCGFREYNRTDEHVYMEKSR